MVFVSQCLTDTRASKLQFCKIKMGLTILPALLLFFWVSVSHSAIVTYELDNDAIPSCPPPQRPCKFLMISLVHEGKEKWRTPRLELQYSKSFGEWHCDFLITDVTNEKKSFMTQCLKGNMTALDGFFEEADKNYHLRFDVETGKQQMIVEDQEASPTSRALEHEDEEDDIIVLRSDQPDALGWNPPGNARIRLRHAELELGVMVDSYFMHLCGNNENEAKRLVHQLMNGVNAIFQSVKITIRIIDFRRIDQSVDDSFEEKQIHNYSTMLAYLPQLYHSVVVSNLQNTNPDQVRGQPDAVLTLTYQRYEDHRAGIAYLNSVCGDMGHVLTMLPRIREDYTGLNSFQDKITFPRALLHRKWSPVIAHEIGHILGLKHMMQCGCMLPRNTCIMSPATVWLGLQWSSCSVSLLRLRLIGTHKDFKDCLFTKDVFENRDIIIVPRVAPALVLETYDYQRNDVVILKVLFTYIAPVSLIMKRSIHLHLEKGFYFFYRNNEASDHFVAIEYSGEKRAYSGVFHMDDRRVNLNPTGRQKYSTKFSQVVNASGTTAVVKEKGVSLDLQVTVLIGMDQAFINMTGGIDAAFLHIVRSINMADAAYRRIGVRIRMTGFHSFRDSGTLIEQAGNFYRLQNKTENVFLLFSSSGNVTSSHRHHQVCSGDNVALVILEKDSYRQGAEVAHQIGHLLGLDDESRCLCDTKLGTCVMNAAGSTRSMLLSNCTFDDLRRLKDEKCIKWITKKRAPTEIIVLRVIVTMFLVIYGLLIFFAICTLMDKAPSATEIRAKLRTRMRRSSPRGDSEVTRL